MVADWDFAKDVATTLTPLAAWEGVKYAKKMQKRK